MVPSVVRYARAARWPVALLAALYACSEPALYPPPQGRAVVPTCAQECAARVAGGCIEKALVANCIPVCEHIREHGLYAPERCRPQ